MEAEQFNNRRLFLSSNSIYKEMGYLEHTAGDMLDFLGGAAEEILFIPFARVAEREQLGTAWAEYAEAPRAVFAPHGIGVVSIHEHPERMKEKIREAGAVFIGGGNTHHLLFWLKRHDLIKPLRERMDRGVPMLGSSAGTNVFCPTIRTTNDMPIVALPDLDAIGGVPFQINPHYLDPDPDSDHRGERREQRINEFLKVAGVAVLGLREGSWLRIETGEIILKGLSDARLFKPDGARPVELTPGDDGRNITNFLI